MPRFFIIDHSLTRVGGHHFVSAFLLASAAREHGYEPVLAANRSFRRRHWPVDCPMLPLYPFSAYAGFSSTMGRHAQPLNPLHATTQGAPPASTSRWGRLGDWWDRWRQRRHVEGFATATRSLFAQFPLSAGDIVFIPTLTEFDLVGLVAFLAEFPEAERAGWHLQFHYPLVKGGWTGEASQHDRVALMREHFHSLVMRVPHVRFQLYVPTPQLAEQYQLLELGPIRVAPTPVQVVPRQSSPPSGDTIGKPLRVLCAGGLRRGKSVDILAPMIDELEQTDFAGGRLQLWVQASWRRQLRRRSGDRPWVTSHPERTAPPDSARLIHVPHPLPTPAYLRLMQDADIGLLAYDARAYAARHSGVLAEFLASGVPVIAPAGTWMATEIEAVAPAPGEASGLIVSDAADYARGLRALAADFMAFRQRALRVAPSYAARHSPDSLFRFVAQVQRDG